MDRRHRRWRANAPDRRFHRRHDRPLRTDRARAAVQDHAGTALGWAAVVGVGMTDYAFLLAVAGIAAFYLGWRMREARAPSSTQADQPTPIPEILPPVPDANVLTTQLHE